MDTSLNNARVLLIGSGADLAGRRLGAVIDRSNRWQLVARCNKHYGSPLDVGRRCELAFVRWRSWLAQEGAAPGHAGGPWWPYDVRCGIRQLVVLNEYQGISAQEHAACAAEAGVDKPSCGLLAAWWLSVRGARVDCIGMGYNGRAWATAKQYATRQADTNDHYDWAAEHRWMAAQPNITLL